METIWTCKSIEFDDLPTVRELLEEADEKILAREIAAIYERDPIDPLPPERAKALRKLARKAIREMRALEPKRPSRKRVFLPATSFDVDAARGQITVETTAQLLTRKDVVAAGAGELDGPLVPESIIFEPWRKVLACRIWLPEELSRKERYLALADIVNEMTFFGWSEKRASSRGRKALRKLERRAKEADGGGRYIPAALAHRRLGLESSTDDYESEYRKRLDEIVRGLNERANAAFDAQAADLGRYLTSSTKN